MARFLGVFPASLTFFVSTACLIGNIWIPALWGHICNHNVTFMKRMVSRRTVARSSSIGGFTFARGALRLCRGGLEIPSWQKLHWFITFPISIWGRLELCFGGIAHQSPPWQRDWFHFTTSDSQLVSGFVLGFFRTMVHWLVNSFILYDAAHTYAKKLSWEEAHVEVTQSREITSHVKYVNAIMFAKISGGQLPGLPVPGCGPYNEPYQINVVHILLWLHCLWKEILLSKESDTKTLQSRPIYFAYEVGIISPYSNRSRPILLFWIPIVPRKTKIMHWTKHCSSIYEGTHSPKHTFL